MKKIIVFAALGFSSMTMAQSFGLNAVNLVGGKQFSTFAFKNSDDEKDKTLKYQMYNAFGVNAELKSDRHIIRPELMFRQAGARTTFNDVQINWKMNYMNLNVGYLYSILEGRMFSIQPGVAIGAGYMLNGEQEIGQTRLNIVEEESMNRFEVSAMGMLNATAQITPSFSIGLEYRFGIGLNDIENDINEQMTRNLYHGVMLNLGFSINTFNKPRI
ncbi:MAG TPA: outer membrane beta-barrel protein [Brumimicrobium sp.]|nr:outer membrane beta-barrel protein [Brumimicrobium sp.]